MSDSQRRALRQVVIALVAAAVLTVGSRGGRVGVFAVVAGKARARVVQLGRRNNTDMQVLSGLDEATRVLLHPGDRARDRTSVVAR